MLELSITISVAQAVFGQQLYADLKDLIASLDSGMLFKTGVSALNELAEAENRDAVILGVSNALAQTWYAAAAVTALSSIGASGMKWAKLKRE